MASRKGNYPKVKRRSKVTNQKTIRVLKIEGEYRPCYVYKWHGKRIVQVVNDRRILERYAKIDRLRHLRPIDSYTPIELRYLSNDELIALARLYNIGYGKIRSTDPIKSRNELINILSEYAKKKRMEKKLRSYTRADLENIIRYLRSEYKLDDLQLRNWQLYNSKSKNLSNDEKYIIRMLSEELAPGYPVRISKEKLIKLVGEKDFHRLEDKLLIQGYNNVYYLKLNCKLFFY